MRESRLGIEAYQKLLNVFWNLCYKIFRSYMAFWFFHTFKLLLRRAQERDSQEDNEVERAVIVP